MEGVVMCGGVAGVKPDKYLVESDLHSAEEQTSSSSTLP